MKARAGRKGIGGFTLIEMMVVVAIMLILTTIAVPLYLNVKKRAHTAEARQGLYAIRKLQKNYFFAHETYSNDINDIDFVMEGKVIYEYTVIAANSKGFSARATANLDRDGALDSWSVDEKGTLLHDVVD